MSDIALLLLYSNTWNHLTGYKQMINNKLKYLKPSVYKRMRSGLFKQNDSQIIYIYIYM